MKNDGLLPFDKALSLILKSVHPVSAEERALRRAAGFALREDVRADRPLPPFNRSAMDGYALRLVALQRGMKKFRVIGALEAGDEWKRNVEKGECLKIMTGAPVPAGLDIVIQVERAKESGGFVEFSDMPPGKFLNIHQKGADAKKGGILLKKGTPLTPRAVAVASAVGAGSVCVARAIAVTVIATGSELAPLAAMPSPAQIRDSNSPLLLARLDALPWVSASSGGIVKDDPKKLNAALKRALAKSDVVILSGGVSMGDADFTPRVLAELGVKTVFHKCAIRPGKPVWFGMKGKKTVFGLPGNPVSVAATFHEFALPALKAMAGFANPFPVKLVLPLAKAAQKKHGLREFRVAAFEGSGVAPVGGYAGSGDFVSAAHSDGLLVIPEETRFLPAGALVEFHPWDIF